MTHDAGGRELDAAGQRPHGPAWSTRWTSSPATASTSTRSRDVLVLVLALYVGASLFMWLQGYILNHVVQRTVQAAARRRRGEADARAAAYFDGQPHGEILSRVTNDIDNVAMALQQTLSQILDALLTAVGVLVMLVVISPLLAVIALVTVPLSVVDHRADRQARAEGLRRAVEARRRAQRSDRGGVHRPRAGQGVRPPRAGRGRGSARRTTSCSTPRFRAQFMSSMIMPAINFIGNLNYVAIAVVGGLRVASGAMRSAACRRSSSTRASSRSSSASSRRSRTCCSPASRRPSACSSCSTRPISRADRSAERRCRRRSAARSASTTSRSATSPTSPLIDDLSLVAKPGQTVAIVGPTGAGKTTLVNLLMRFYDLDGGAILLDGIDIARCRAATLRAQDRHGAARHLAVRRHDPRQHQVRQPGATDDADARRGEGDLRRSLRARAARRLRHRDRRGELRTCQRRREAADHDRARVPRGSVDPDPRRGDVVGRHPHRGARAARDGDAARAPHELRDRAPAVDDPRRRPHPRDGAAARSSSRARTTQLLAAGGAYHALYHAQFAAPAAS